MNVIRKKTVNAKFHQKINKTNISNAETILEPLLSQNIMAVNITRVTITLKKVLQQYDSTYMLSIALTESMSHFPRKITQNEYAWHFNNIHSLKHFN